MTKQFSPGESIEGENILVTGQKIITGSRPQKLNDEGLVGYKLTIERGGEAEVQKELKANSSAIWHDSLRLVGDRVEGSVLRGFYRKPKGLTPKKGTRRSASGGHSRQEVTVKGGCGVRILEALGTGERYAGSFL